MVTTTCGPKFAMRFFFEKKTAMRQLIANHATKNHQKPEQSRTSFIPTELAVRPVHSLYIAEIPVWVKQSAKFDPYDTLA